MDDLRLLRDAAGLADRVPAHPRARRRRAHRALVEAFHAVEPEVERDLPTARVQGDPARGRSRAPRARAGVEVDGESARRAVAHDRGVPGHGRPRSQELQRQGWKLGILTNCDDDLFESTRAALGVEIDLVVTAEAVRSYKPALGHFERFEASTGVDRRRLGPRRGQLVARHGPGARARAAPRLGRPRGLRA